MKKPLLIILLGILLSSVISAQGYLWTKQSVGEVGEGSATGQDVVCDKDGNTYVVGEFNNTVYFGDSVISGNFGIMYIVKYDQQGNPLWVRQINGNSNNKTYGVALDNEQDLYICGRYKQTNDLTVLDFGTIQVTGNPSLSTFIAKIDKEGNWQWVNKILSENPVGQQICQPDEVLVTPSGDVFLAGSLNSAVTIDGNPYNSEGGDAGSYYFARFSSTGDLDWFASGKGVFTGIEMALATDGNIFFAGTASNTIHFANDSIAGPGSDDVLFGAMNQDGSLLWWQTAGHPSYDERPFGIAMDQYNNIYLAFLNYFWVKIGDLQVDYNSVVDQYLYKFDDQGNFIWMQPLYSGSVGGANGISSLDILADPNGNTYVTGLMESPAYFGNPLFFSDTVGGFGYKECYLAAYNQDGSYTDVVDFVFDNDYDAGEFIPSHMVFDHNLNITITGTFRDNIMVGDDMIESGPLKQMFILKVNPSELFVSSTGIPNKLKSVVEMDVYPNPATNILNIIKNERAGICEYQIADTQGRVIISGTTFDTELRLDIDHLESGTYLMQIIDKNWIGRKAFIKL